ncbi:MAG: hypothetical protein FRX49_13376 [Trebouxia sp. A1-2]|nr:MAG: hypothetical protein FRX49_13376 [Trebouxia sp. A1-2]
MQGESKTDLIGSRLHQVRARRGALGAAAMKLPKVDGKPADKPNWTMSQTPVALRSLLLLLLGGEVIGGAAGTPTGSTMMACSTAELGMSAGAWNCTACGAAAGWGLAVATI